MEIKYHITVIDENNIIIVDEQYYESQCYYVSQSKDHSQMITELMSNYPAIFSSYCKFIVYCSSGVYTASRF